MKISILQTLITVVLTVNAYAHKANSQNILDKMFSVNVENVALNNLLKKVGSQTDVKFVYSSNSINAARKVTYSAFNQTVRQFLNDGLKHYGIGFKIIDEQVVLFPSGQSVEINTVNPKRIYQPQKSVSGKVTNDKGEPLAGVTVTEKGTRNVTTTNANGDYEISVSDHAVLEFSYVGYMSKEAVVTTQQVINITLGTNIQDLNEVVVVAYGTQRRSNVTGALDQVRSSALQDRPSVNLVQSLQGTAPSLVIQQTSFEPGQGLNINIMGVSTMNDNNPLVVVDGVTGGNLDLINPADIESISVLKDAGAAAIYGSRSANGVILVTTKKGKASKTPVISYNGIVGIQKPKVWFRPVQSFENAILRNEASVNGGGTPIYTATQVQHYKDVGSEQWFLDAILKPALQQNHNLSLSGGSKAFAYVVSGGYVNQRSNYVGPNYGLKRYNFRTNLSTEIGKFKAGATFAYARRYMNDHSFNSGTLVVDASRVPTYYKIKDSAGRYLTNETTSEFNSLGILEKGGYRNYIDNDLFGSVSAEYMIVKGLKIKGVFGATRFVSDMEEKRNFLQFYMNGAPQGSYGGDRNLNTSHYWDLFTNPQIMLDYNRILNKHEITGLAGFANESFSGRRTEVRKRYVNDTEIIDDPQLQNENNRNARDRSLNSYFGRVGYTYDGKYIAEASARYDGSSKFRKEIRWGFFPSASLGWVVSKENFIHNNFSNLSFLKFRASYGILGNQSVDDYQYQTVYEMYPNAYGFNNDSRSGVIYRLANPDLTWEKAATFNVGVDATIFKNLSFNFDYFNKLTSDILIQPSIPGLWGHGGDGNNIPKYNAGKVRNSGWEFNVNYMHNGDVLKHNIGFNIGDSKNKVEYIEGGERFDGADEMQLIIREGLPYHSYVGLKRDGYFQNLDDILNGPKPNGVNVLPGDIRYVDVDNNGVIDDKDRFVLGNPFPRYTFGFNYSVTWNLLDLSLMIQGVGKRAQFVRGELVEPFHFNYSQVIYQHQLDYWTPFNTDARYPRLATAGSASNTNNFRRGSDLYLFDAAYARLKNIQVGFTFPKNVVSRAGIQKARLYFVGQNILTISKLKFLDPESTEFNNNMSNSGANSGRVYPTPIFYGVGLDVTFK